MSVRAGDLELLMRARHPLLVLDTDEDERAVNLLSSVCERLGHTRLVWNAASGLRKLGEPQPIYGTTKLDACLEHIAASGASQVVYHLCGAAELFDDAERAAKLVALADPLSRNQSYVVLSGPAAWLPLKVQRSACIVSFERPSDIEYYQLVNTLLSDMRKVMPVRMEMTPAESGALIAQLRGLTFFEVRKVMTQAMVRDGRLAPDDMEFVVRQKRELVDQSGVLEYVDTDSSLADIAGLTRLKHWLELRAPVFRDPARALEFGLSAPRGLLLLGVQGCGKSLCAKAVAKSWGLPLLRLDPARLYDKYLGESEKNLRRAMALAQRLSPVTLWIDEVEKVFGTSQGEDSGAAQRVLGAFLTWLQEKHESVFVIATSNDISRLPPELLRKGRFDEIFFVDLPEAQVRAQILALQLKKRRRDPDHFDLAALAERSEGFSGAELEQAVVAGLYDAFAEGSELAQRHLEEEIERTRPLSKTMAEPITSLRAWARGRTVFAE